MTTETQSLELVGNQRLLVERRPVDNILKLIGSDGRVQLSICITADGAVLHVEGPSLRLESVGDLAIDARSIALHGREGVAITSDGDACIRIAGELNSDALIQNIAARLGNVNVTANDDVKLTGERIKLNC